LIGRTFDEHHYEHEAMSHSDSHAGHPKDRAWQPEDPLMMRAVPVNGAPELMLDCLIEEYAHQGWDREALLKLFDDPFFKATHGLKGLLGEQALRDRVDEVLGRCGVIRCTVSLGSTGSRGETGEENHA
jgi:hypothetical protein